MNNNFTLKLLTFCAWLFVSTFSHAQTIRVIDNKGTVKIIDNSKWTLSGSNIFNKNSGNIGIGISLPQAKLHVDGTIRFENFGTNTTNTNILTTDANGNVTNRTLSSLLNNNAITSLNGLTNSIQTFDIGTSGTDFNINSSGSSHAFNIPDASITNRGLVTINTQTFAGLKTFSSTPTFSTMSSGSVLFSGIGGLLSQNNANFFWDNTNARLGLGTTSPTARLTFAAGDTVNSLGALTINSAASNALTLDSGTTGAINIGNNSNAKTITIGNTTGATSINLNSGTGAINIGNSIAKTITIGNTTGATALNLNSGTGTQTHSSLVATSTAFNSIANSLTTGIASNFTINNSVSTGQALNISTTSTTLNSTNGFFRVVNLGMPLNSNGLFTRIQPNNTSGSGLTILNNGNIGIGIALPSAQLHTTGTLRFAGLGTNTIDTNIVTTDVNGNVTTRALSNLLSNSAITSLNGLTNSIQTFATGTTGTDFSILSSGSIHIFNFPSSSSSNRGLLEASDWTIFNNKQNTVSLSVIGNNGASTFNPLSGNLNIPNYTLAGLGGISLTSLTATTPLNYNDTIGEFSISQSNSTTDGFLSSSDWNTFDNKQNSLVFTTVGFSGASTFNASTGALNIPNYTLSGLGGISLTGLTASAPLNYNNTTGAFSITQASTSANGFLTSTDWNTFNNKQNTLTFSTGLTNTSNTITLNPATASGLGGIKVGSGLNILGDGTLSVASVATTVSNTSSVNNLSTTVNGVTGTAVPMINTNILSSASGNVTSTINGVSSGAVALAGITTSNLSATAGIINTQLANSNITINGTSIVLGGTGTITAAPSGAAGGDLTGTYPNPTISNNAVTSAKIFDGTVANADLATMAANTVKLNATAGTASPTDVAVSTNSLLGRGAGNIAPIALGTGLSITGSILNATGGTVTNVTGTSPISVATGTTTPAISIATANTTTTGAISSADWNTFNNKQNALSLTTTGTSGSATLVGSTINIPVYAGISSLNGLTNNTQTFATGTTGTNLNIVSSGSTHTINIPDASTANRGLVTTGVQTFGGNKTFDNNIAINGTFKLGSSGSVLNNVIKGTATVSVPSFFWNTAHPIINVTVTGANVGAMVILNPTANLPAKLIVAYCRISAANTLTIGFATGDAITGASVTFDVLIIQ